MQTDTQPNEGQRIQNSLKIGPYILLDNGTICFVIITILFSLNLIHKSLILQKFLFVRTTKALCIEPTLNFF